MCWDSWHCWPASGCTKRRSDSLPVVCVHLRGVYMPKFSQRLQGITYPKWEPEYLSALTETDSLKVKEKIQIAQAALLVRSMDKTSPPSEAEQQAMQEAMS